MGMMLTLPQRLTRCYQSTLPTCITNFKKFAIIDDVISQIESKMD